MKKTIIPIANKVEKKTDEIIKKYIEDSGKLEFFFNYFVHYRNIKGSYPNLDNLREYLFTKILDAISNNKKIGFYFKDISNLDNSEKYKFGAKKIITELKSFWLINKFENNNI